MSSVTAIGGARANGVIKIADAGLTGMITLRGDLTDADLGKAVKTTTGCALPAARQIVHSKRAGVAWMSPDEVLLITDYTAADQIVAKLDRALKGHHFMAVNVSDARQVFDLSGPLLREVLAKGTPADMSPDALGIGELRRTRLGQLPVAFWLDAPDHARLICFRSVAQHVFNWLANAADRSGKISYF